MSIAVNHISWNDTGYAFAGFSASTLMNCASGGATRGAALVDQGEIALTSEGSGGASPFSDGDNGSFSLTATGNGALCRAAGLSPYGQTGYLDIGAVQHQAAVSGGGCIIPTTTAQTGIWSL
jgi:hypothetical protein